MTWERLLILLAVGRLLFPDTALGDGGTLRMRAAGDPWTVSLFTPPNLSSAAPTDLAVLVQHRATGQLIHDAVVNLELSPPAGVIARAADVFCGPANELPPQFRNRTAGQPDTFPALLGRPDNPLLYVARMRMPSPGHWTVRIHVRRGPESLSAHALLPVGGPGERLRALWPSLLLPPVAVLLYSVNHALRRRP